MLAIPTVKDLIDIYNGGIRGQRDENADTRRGSSYELIGAPAAMIFNREALADEDLLRAVSFEHADGSDLTNMGLSRYGIARILDTQGVGVAQLTRPTAVAAGGTIWAGTRIQLYGQLYDAKIYVVTNDTIVGTNDLVANVAIHALDYGTGHAADTKAGASIVDPIWDASWTVARLTCADGTDIEDADKYRARVRRQKKLARKGYPTAIEKACTDAGAVHVAYFPSTYSGTNDFGLSTIYVGDGGYNANTALLNACRIAVDGFRCAGDHLQVRPMAAQRLVVNVTVQLYDQPALYDTVRLTSLIQSCLLQYIGKDGSYGYRLSAMGAAIFRPIEQIQTVTFAVPSSDVTVLQTSGGLPNLPGTLIRYFLSAADITSTLVGPS